MRNNANYNKNLLLLKLKNDVQEIKSYRQVTTFDSYAPTPEYNSPQNEKDFASQEREREDVKNRERAQDIKRSQLNFSDKKRKTLVRSSPPHTHTAQEDVKLKAKVAYEEKLQQEEDIRVAKEV